MQNVEFKYMQNTPSKAQTQDYTYLYSALRIDTFDDFECSQECEN